MKRRKGVLVKAGEYKYGDTVEVKTAEELKAAAERQPIIMLTRGHPHDGVVSAKDVIGTVSQKWDEQHQRVNIDVWAHEEKLTDAEREKFDNFQPIPVSGGFAIDGIGEHGEQQGIVYTHVAMLNEEDPRCPLGECGINVRSDSKEGQKLVRFDQKTDLEAPAEPTKEEILEAIEVEQEEPKEEAPPAEDPAEVADEVEAEPEPAIQKEEVVREPETPIPVSTAGTDAMKAAGIRKVGNAYEYVPRAYRSKGDE